MDRKWQKDGHSELSFTQGNICYMTIKAKEQWGELESIPAGTGRDIGHHSQVKLSFIFLDCGKKLEDVHAGTGRMFLLTFHGVKVYHGYNTTGHGREVSGCWYTIQYLPYSKQICLLEPLYTSHLADLGGHFCNRTFAQMKTSEGQDARLRCADYLELSAKCEKSIKSIEIWQKKKRRDGRRWNELKSQA